MKFLAFSFGELLLLCQKNYIIEGDGLRAN